MAQDKDPRPTMTAEEETAPEKPMRPMLQKPPGYRDPHAPPPETGKGTKLLQRKQLLLPASLYPEEKKRRRRSRCRVFWCCFCISVAVVVFLLLLTAALFFLWYSPKLPVVRLASFRLQTLNFSGGKPDDGWSLMTAETTARLNFRNPNGKLRYYYGDADVALTVGDGDFETAVGSTRVKGFVEKPGNRTVVIVSSRLRNQQVDDPTAKRLREELKSKTLVVKVTARTRVGLGVGRRRIGTVGVSLKCGGVRLQTLDSNMAKCSIKMLKWITLHS
ncbi:PREDICTED: uncharacterized protein LOC104825868 [Tarenaya hassleriana]|uniref:uncharacterized protein LOC104825868 n=1 Tax=Tarenaya hassleriana TaxID=28532 RepID=UPI00053C54DC|nr:PREDICTED: uncharacterized protein LOC104825868 [Tarenaya hassleriana]